MAAPHFLRREQAGQRPSCYLNYYISTSQQPSQVGCSERLRANQTESKVSTVKVTRSTTIFMWLNSCLYGVFKCCRRRYFISSRRVTAALQSLSWSFILDRFLKILRCWSVGPGITIPLSIRRPLMRFFSRGFSTRGPWLSGRQDLIWPRSIYHG